MCELDPAVSATCLFLLALAMAMMLQHVRGATSIREVGLGKLAVNTWKGAVLRAEKNGTPLEEFEEIVFEKLLTSSPNSEE
jgi:hypothetical protein